MVDYVHLTLHSEYSLVDGLVRVPDMLDQIVKMQMPAVALTDQSNVFAMVKFYRTAIKQGIKPIIGADVFVGESKEDTNPCRLTLLCANREGFRNLSRLLTLGYIEGRQHAQTILLKEWFKPDSLKGLIALSGGQFGEVGRALLSAKPDNATKVLDEWTTRFPGRFYIELHRVGRTDENIHVTRAVNIASQREIPIVATNDVRFIQRTDFEANEARICIQQGCTLDDPTRPRNYTEEQYLKLSLIHI